MHMVSAGDFWPLWLSIGLFALESFLVFIRYAGAFAILLLP